MKIPRKFILNVIVDTLAFVSFIMLTSTGVIMKYLLPPGSGKSVTIWAMDRHAWGDIHFWTSITLFSVLALHVVLHWNWIVGVFKGKTQNTGYRFLLGVVGLFALVLLVFAPVISPVEKSESKSEHSDSHKEETNGDLHIRGSMTFSEVTDATGVPMRFLIYQLGLPQGISPSEKIGPLQETYGYTMEEVRQVIANYRANQ